MADRAAAGPPVVDAREPAAWRRQERETLRVMVSNEFYLDEFGLGLFAADRKLYHMHCIAVIRALHRIAVVRP